MTNSIELFEQRKDELFAKLSAIYDNVEIRNSTSEDNWKQEDHGYVIGIGDMDVRVSYFADLNNSGSAVIRHYIDNSYMTVRNRTDKQSPFSQMPMQVTEDIITDIVKFISILKQCARDKQAK